ncbi:MAG: flagellar protein FlaG [Acidobacteria bacterium]|jgi:flagellar protein FlaG|nr:flagellar protein FlaG [Acidobacteriota bacterium]
MEPKSINQFSSISSAATLDLDRQQVEDRRTLVRAVKAINESALFGENYELTFVFDRPNQKTLVRIIDRQTKEVIRQVPSEYALRMASQLQTD